MDWGLGRYERIAGRRRRRGTRSRPWPACSAGSVEVEKRTLVRTGTSAAEFAADKLADHPIWAATRELLDPRGEWQGVHDRAIGLFAAANEDPDGFQVTSPYVIVTARRA